ncbi:hypothetical protein T484DRAFT_1885406 [Baffinella frigidus]|nr:hypothetical protein T484DRAFT_1885406 [Cryptophyta sp. CCMP2293]
MGLSQTLPLVVACLAGAAAAAMLMRAQGPSPGRKIQRLMFRTAVRKDKLELYKRHHRAVFAEVEAGLRANGVQLLTIFMPADGSNVLQMYIEADAQLDMGKDLGAGSDYRSNRRVKEWEELMNTFFETGSWEQLQELYTLTPSTSTNTLPSLYAD